ncbi:hypothetical protein B0T18DRAFT_373255 [Schizothecium vesticola]|uniref:tRNA(Ile)-lysidine synthetase n=1 Tax=Schizothecium vesticola TaxID=314040 RepID=A0AA40JZ41_9PEZI|nr:hypothetical protein B0T18DRAFT_373255 [Schizothecium vesticola]
MNAPPVLHRGAKAILAPEFFDALQATCLPRYPGVRGTEPRRVALALSGGVDSMALAYLCYQFQKRYRFSKLSDNPLHHFQAVIINHDLREGSLEEAIKVANVLRDRFNMPATVHPAKWAEVLAPGQHHKDVPNVETLARQARYRRIGDFCKNSGIASLLTAHHEGDQYETVLMRLLAGHAYRGLRGMRAATDIPECYDMHGSYQSGFHDDQERVSPYYNLRPTRRDKKKMRASLREEALEAAADDVNDALKSFGFDYLEYEGIALGKRAPLPMPLDCEDGGIMMYRPLLEFSKERLIATCLENGVPWFEDHTNQDPTLTTRNAIRHMYKNYTLPVALQKPSILHLAERCRQRVHREEAEAQKLASHALVLDFEPSVGTAVVEFRPFRLPAVPRRSTTSPAARQRRIAHFRHIAAIMIRRLISLVTPERDLSPLAQLDHLVSLLFPSLADASSPRPPSPPKAYVICGVHFTPLIGDYPLRWLLSRAPPVSHVPRPTAKLNQLGLRYRLSHPRNWKKGHWSPWVQFDGRYWARSRTRLPFKVFLAPFEPEHQKAFRTALGDDRAKDDLARMLRRYAPAKVRYTLPALYVNAPITELLEGGGHWPPYSDLFPASDALGEEDAEGGAAEDGTAEGGTMGMSYKKRLVARRLLWENELVRNAKPQLIALPTLGVALPGLEEWVDVEIRYRKVDHNVIHAGAVGRERERGRRRALEAIRRHPPRSRRRVA